MQPRTITFQAGGTNIHYGRIGYWLATSLLPQIGNGEVQLKVGNAYRDITAVGRGITHLGIVTPAIAARQCYLGQGPYAHPHPDLRSIGVVPHRDALVLGVAAELDVESLDDIRERRISLQLAGPRGRSLLGIASERMLAAHGITPRFLEECGGAWLDESNAQTGWKLMAEGKINAFVQESVAMAFRPLSRVRPIRLLPIREGVAQELETEFGYQRKVIPPGTIVGQEDPVLALNWDHWIVVAHTSLPEDLAYAAADAFLTGTARLERQYTADNRLPDDEHPLEYPMRPDVIANEVTVPLHTGAEARYREAGVLRART